MTWNDETCKVNFTSPSDVGEQIQVRGVNSGRSMVPVNVDLTALFDRYNETLSIHRFGRELKELRVSFAVALHEISSKLDHISQAPMDSNRPTSSPNSESTVFHQLNRNKSEQSVSTINHIPPQSVQEKATPLAGALSNRRVSVPRKQIPDRNLTVMKLGDREVVFNKTTITPPLMKHFSKDISGLFIEWEESNLFVVNGVSIPLKYWDKFFQKKSGIALAKQGAWEKIKVTWGMWKVRTMREPHCSV
ncbi:hypothetical protein C8Q75DRAFT_231376 [Abortiporus biennis]|nr:hypothetical protein C8Q75DRAFT_231376 [Abortiporus biennis]